MPKVAIIGTGMASFVAAQAVHNFYQGDAHLMLFGPNREPVAAGARWYEREIPGIDVLNRIVKTESVGSADDYVSKVGGPVTKYFAARNNFLGFNYNDAHQMLWQKFAPNIVEAEPNYEFVTAPSTHLWSQFDYVLNTMPRPMFYPREEQGMFAATRHWRLDEMNDGTTNPYTLPGNQDKNLMIFDGTDIASYFRVTQLFGLMSVEWGFHKRPPLEGVYLEILPLGVPSEVGLRTIIPGWRDAGVLAHIGALAKWEPSTDAGEVYAEVIDVLEGNWNGETADDHDRWRHDSVAKTTPSEEVFKEEEKGDG